MRTARKDIDLDILRTRIIEVKEQGTKIISHFKKLEEYYSEWEDRLNEIQEQINKAEKQYGIPPKELEQSCVLDDILGG